MARPVNSSLNPSNQTIPKWIHAPPKGCAVGYAGLHAFQHEARRKAEAAILASLARMSGAKVQQITRLEQRANGNVISQNIQVNSKIKTNGEVGAVRFIKYWTDRFNRVGQGTGSTYVLGCIK